MICVDDNNTKQEAFCKGTSCVIQRINDQSSQKNHLDIAPSGGNANHEDKPVNASRQLLTINNNRVYGAYFEGGMGYRIDNSSGIATGNEPETIYMVTAGKHYNDGCCFEYGNAEKNSDHYGSIVFWK